MDVCLVFQQFQRGVGVAQAIQRSILALSIRQQATILHQPFKNPIQAGRLVAIGEHENLLTRVLLTNPAPMSFQTPFLLLRL